MATVSKKTLAAMTPAELDEHFERGGNVLLGSVVDATDKGPAPDSLPTVDPDDAEKLVTTSVRLPLAMLDRLSVAAGRDREGKSGIIRQALDEWFARHPEAA